MKISGKIHGYVEGWRAVALFHNLTTAGPTENVTLDQNLVEKKSEPTVFLKPVIQVEARAGKEDLRCECGWSIIGRRGRPAWWGLESEGGEWEQNYEGAYCYFKHLGIILSDKENLWRGSYLITVVVVCVCHDFDSFPLQSYIFRYASWFFLTDLQ